MKTAVEWYIKKIKEARKMCDDTSMEMDIWHTLDVLIEKGKQAKEMEKQQIIDCGNTCAIKQHIHIEKVNKMTMDEMLEFANTQTVTIGEEYYNETFNK
jgi:hypothetical protein